MLCVLDASLAIELALPPPGGGDFRHLIGPLQVHGVLVPDIWHWEVVNVALKHERRRRVSTQRTDIAIERVRGLVAETELTAGEDAATRLRELARAQHITLFDAAYLDLSACWGLPLATLDSGLAAAARRLGVRLLPLAP